MRSLLVLLASCASQTPHIVVHGDEVLRHLDELTENDQALLSTRRIDGGGEKAEGNETVFLYQTVSVDGTTTTLEQALAGCGSLASNHPCKITAATRIVVREVSANVLAEERAARSSHPDDDPGPHTNGYNPGLAAITGPLALAAFAGMGACIGLCDGDTKGEGAVALGVTGLVLGTIWAVASGGRD